VTDAADGMPGASLRTALSAEPGLQAGIAARTRLPGYQLRPAAITPRKAACFRGDPPPSLVP